MIGNNAPRYRYNITANFQYKGFDLDLMSKVWANETIGCRLLPVIGATEPVHGKYTTTRGLPKEQMQNSRCMVPVQAVTPKQVICLMLPISN